MELNDSAEMNEPPLLAIGRQSYGLGSVENEHQASSSNWPLGDCNGSNMNSKNEFWHLENDAWRTFSADLPQPRAMPGFHRAKRQHRWGATSHISNNLDEQGPGPSRTHLGCEADFGQGLQTELFGYRETTSSGTTGFDFFQTGLDVAGSSSSSSLPPPSLMPGNGSRQVAATGTGSWSAYGGSGTDLSQPIGCFTDGEWKITRDLMPISVGQSTENISGKSLNHLDTSAAGGVGDGGCLNTSVFPNSLSPQEGEGGKPFFQSGGFAGSSTDYSGDTRSDHVHGDVRCAYKRKRSAVDFADAPAFDPHFAARRESVGARTAGTGTNRSDSNGFSNSNATSNPSMIQIWDDSHNDCTGYVGNDNDYSQSLRGSSERVSTLIGIGEDVSRNLQNQPFSMPQEASHSQLHSLFARNLRRTAHSHTSTRREPDVFGGNAASSTSALRDNDNWPAMFSERSSAPPVLPNWGVNSGLRRTFSSSGSRERAGSNVVSEGSRIRSMTGRGPEWAAAAAAMENRLSQTIASGGVAGPTGREMNPPDLSAYTSQAANSFLNSGALSSYFAASGLNGHRVSRNPAPPPPISTANNHQLPLGPPLEVPLSSAGQHAGRYASPSPSRGGRREALLAGPVQSVLGLPFRGLHMLRADGEYRRQFLSEILTAMHHAFRSEDLNIEELVMLDPSLIYGGVDAHDQHSDMRLDVDNMSYEELLALEERIGNVSTGLDDEKISLCLRESKYSSLDATVAAISQESDVKCSICQEEFVEEDELGRLDCGHGYHSVCIKQWLLQKNECPICKSSAYLKA